MFLLDINVLLALSDPRHVDHERAHLWFRTAATRGWATCPLTENGFIRIASHPSYPNRPGDVVVTRELFGRFCAHPKHVFWPDDATLMDGGAFTFRPGLGHAHLTDVYLLGLAVRHRGHLATFDRRIPVDAVVGGAAALALLA